ncbi:MAG: hypothetical protein HKO84_05050, partial [Pseudomonadales bacterium]|nr:hypothetical protein [Pseudomonadales bacterium]
GLLDALLLMALVENDGKAAVIKVAASGFSKSSSQAIFASLMESLDWKP